MYNETDPSGRRISNVTHITSCRSLGVWYAEDVLGRNGGRERRTNNWTPLRSLNTNRKLTDSQMRPENCPEKNTTATDSFFHLRYIFVCEITGNWTWK